MKTKDTSKESFEDWFNSGSHFSNYWRIDDEILSEYKTQYELGSRYTWDYLKSKLDKKENYIKELKNEVKKCLGETKLKRMELEQKDARIKELEERADTLQEYYFKFKEENEYLRSGIHNIILDIKEEIIRMLPKQSIGKSGCVARLENLIFKKYPKDK